MIAAHLGHAVARRVLIPVLFVVLSISPSRASGEGCGSIWAFDLGSFSECENATVLAPGNDTRVNLLLLLFNRYGWPPKPPKPVATPIQEWRDFRDGVSIERATKGGNFAIGEGSRCRSNDDGAAAFTTAVAAIRDLPPGERAALASARGGLKSDCAASIGPSAVVEDIVRNSKSEIGHAFAIYLRAADAFYGGRFDDAAKDFETSGRSADPWLADTGAYMAARTLVNRLQVDAFDSYGDFKGSAAIDQAAATRAEASLQDYVARHPTGRYVGSARGLLRRVAWLAGRTEMLAALYASLLAKPASARDIDDVSLAQEIDSKLLPGLTPEMTKDTILLAVLDLKGMRKPAGPKAGRPAIGPAAIEAQGDAFAAAPQLHAFLAAAAAFFVDGASAPVIQGLPDDARRRDGDTLWFSRQFLRGQALEAAGDRNARGFWKELYPGLTRPLDRAAVELALALNDERHGKLADVFASGSLVTAPALHTILLERGAGPSLLGAVAHDANAPGRERKVALLTLLFKDLTRGRYADFRADLGDVPPDAAFKGAIAPDPEGNDEPPLGIFTQGESAGEIECPALIATAERLEKDPRSVRDRLCLAEFVRLNGMDQSPLDIPTPRGNLGSAPSTFPGEPYARTSTYRAIIADRQAAAADRAYALYRAVKCYEPTGNNECGAPDVPKAERKAWYNALKHDYPASRWAKGLSYWW